MFSGSLSARIPNRDSLIKLGRRVGEGERLVCNFESKGIGLMDSIGLADSSPG